MAAIALALFVVGAHTAWRYWMQVIEEQQTAAYEVHIAYGLSTVTFAGAIGSAVSLLLIVTLLAAIRVHRET